MDRPGRRDQKDGPGDAARLVDLPGDLFASTELAAQCGDSTEVER
jgi:hypothetical protein